MRIAGLHLQAYGHFSGCSIDFGQGWEGAPGLHIVYGHNEAGKSTTLRALSSVLFGYPHQIIDGFKHGAADIAIGIDLVASDGSKLSFVRRRRGRKTLTAADGTALEESTVERFLGGVSRDVFEKVFALDHHRLRAHARALLADGGSLGFSLAEAGSGIAGLKTVLEKLKTERNGLFLAAGRNPKLNQAIAELTKLRRDARQHTVSPTEYRSHEKHIQETEAELQRVRERLTEIESSAVRLQRIKKNLPLRAEHRAWTQRVEALDGVPELPPEFAQQRVKACTDLDAAREDIATASDAAEHLKHRIAAISLDLDVLAQGADIESLAQRRPVIEKNEIDLPKRETERAEHFARAADLMARAELDGGPADLGSMLPSSLKRKAIQTLADDGKRLAVQRADAQENAEAAARILERARERAAQTPEPRPAGDLARTLTAADKLGDIAGDIARRTLAVERKTKALHQTIAGLVGNIAVPPAIDGVAALRELAVPPKETERRYAASLGEVDRGTRDARETLERLNRELVDIDQRIVAMKTAGDFATEDDLKSAREARDQGWGIVRGLYVDRRAGLEDDVREFAPDGRVAEAYEARIREADRVVDTLRAHIEESTELALLKRRAADLNANRAGLIAAITSLGARRDALLSEWRALWPEGLITVQAPGEMIEWLGRRDAALADADALGEERDAISERADRERVAREGLAAAMTAFAAEPFSGSLDALRERARGIIDEVAKAKSRYDKAETAVRERSEQKITADEAADRGESRIEEWTARWREALAAAGLPSALTIDAASATLGLINDLDGLKSKIDGLNHRIETMREERGVFGDAVAAVGAALPDAPAGPAAAVCRRLEERLRLAREAERDRQHLAEQLENRAADRDRAREKLERSRTALDALCVQAGCASADELVEIERKAADKQEALREREKIETRVREDGEGRDFAALFAECDDVPADRIPADLIGLAADRADTEAGIEKLVSERARLQAEFERLLGQNEAAGLAQEAAAVQAEIEDAVETWVDLTVQETLLREAINVYRDRNQGPILTRARELFVQLTDGAYAGLRADVNGDETVLMVEDPSRGSLEIDALSDGTMDAVYLALRLAVVQEHNATHEPLPFIADDLLLNLDNGRSEAALRTLATLAASSQVLLFTHHAHMLTLARNAVPPGLLMEHSLSPLDGSTTSQGGLAEGVTRRLQALGIISARTAS